MTSRNRGFDNNQQENLTLLKVYTVYRVLLCFGLLATFLFSTNIFIIGGLKPNQFFYVTMLYLAVNLVGLVAILPKKTPFNSQQLFANFLFDITFIIAIIDASNGVDSGLGILFVVIIAASSIVLTSQLAALVAAIVGMAHGLNIEIVAEGVENRYQADYLESLGCYIMQGFMFSKPVKVEEFLERVAAQQAALPNRLNA